MMGRKRHHSEAHTVTIKPAEKRDLVDQLLLQFTENEFSELIRAFFRRDSIRTVT